MLLGDFSLKLILHMVVNIVPLALLLYHVRAHERFPRVRTTALKVGRVKEYGQNPKRLAPNSSGIHHYLYQRGGDNSPGHLHIRSRPSTPTRLHNIAQRVRLPLRALQLCAWGVERGLAEALPHHTPPLVCCAAAAWLGHAATHPLYQHQMGNGGGVGGDQDED